MVSPSQGRGWHPVARPSRRGVKAGTGTKGLLTQLCFRNLFRELYKELWGGLCSFSFMSPLVLVTSESVPETWFLLRGALVPVTPVTHRIVEAWEGDA